MLNTPPGTCNIGTLITVVCTECAEVKASSDHLTHFMLVLASPQELTENELARLQDAVSADLTRYSRNHCYTAHVSNISCGDDWQIRVEIRKSAKPQPRKPAHRS